MVKVSQHNTYEDTEQSPLIKAVHVFSSGRAEQHKEHRFGTWKPQMWWVLMSRSWVPVPINYFLIEHQNGLILFDTGLDPAIVTNPGYINRAIGRFLLRRIFRLYLTEDDRIDHILTKNGFAAADIQTAVMSHLHFDHVGGIAQIPQAKLLVSAREWAQLDEPHPEYEWVLSEHIMIPNADWQSIDFGPTDDPLFDGFDGIYDVAGDGSLILFLTPGHTPGSLSMLIRRAGWHPILLVGDLAYQADLLQSDTIPGTGDAAQLRDSYAKIRQLNERLPNMVIVPSHDLSAAQNIERAMNPPAQNGACE